MEFEIRVDRLERENRRIKRVGLTVLVVACLVITMGQAKPQQPDVVRATN